MSKVLVLPVFVVYVTCGTEPFQFATGVKVYSPSLPIVSLPMFASVTVSPAFTVAPFTVKLATVSVSSRSLSFASTFPLATESSNTVFVSAARTLGSLTGVTPIVTVDVAVPPLPSSIVTVKLSVPL